GGMVLVGDYVYFGNAHGQGHPACVEFKTGEIKWKETRGAAGGDGAAGGLHAGGVVYFRYPSGKMGLIQPEPEKLEAFPSFDRREKINQPTWPHPVIANGRLYIRDQEKLHCFNVKATTN